MIRIHKIRERSTLRLIVEGKLSGDWVDALEKCWVDARTDPGDERIRVDLSSVGYIDEKGRRLLKNMLTEGAEFRATGVMTRGILEEIAGDADLRERLHIRLERERPRLNSQLEMLVSFREQLESAIRETDAKLESVPERF